MILLHLLNKTLGYPQTMYFSNRKALIIQIRILVSAIIDIERLISPCKKIRILFSFAILNSSSHLDTTGLKLLSVPTLESLISRAARASSTS